MIKDVIVLTSEDCLKIEKKFPSIYLLVIQKFIKSNNPFSHLLLYCQNDEILGLLWYDILYEKMEICQFEVVKEVQNQHIGSQLLEKLLSIAIENKIENITLEVRESNQKAIYLYQKFGFVSRFKRKSYYHGEDGLLMEKEVIK